MTGIKKEYEYPMLNPIVKECGEIIGFKYSKEYLSFMESLKDDNFKIGKTIITFKRYLLNYYNKSSLTIEEIQNIFSKNYNDFKESIGVING